MMLSVKVLATTNLHPQDEPDFSEEVLFRPPYALPISCTLHIDRFTSCANDNNIMVNISNDPTDDKSGYVVEFSSFEEIIFTDPNLSREDPSECQSVAFNYWQGYNLKRYRATPLTRDNVINAIQIIFVHDYEPADDEDVHTLLKEYLKLLEARLPQSSKASENLQFVKKNMAPLLDENLGLPCWERGAMNTVLSEISDSTNEEIDEFILECENGYVATPCPNVFCRPFILRWIFSNLPFLSKIISHKTDGVHRDFAHDALLAGTFGTFEGDVLTRLTARFLEEPNRIRNKLIYVNYTIPTEFI